MKVKRDYIVFYFAPFLVALRMGSIMIAVPLFAISLGASSLALGMLGFTSGLTYISLCFLFGKLSEKKQRKNLVVLGSSIYIASCLILCFSSRIYQLYLAVLLTGIAAAMFWPILEVWIAEKKSKRPLYQRMGLFNTSWSAGVILGPLVGGILFGINFKLPFYFALIMSVFVFFILLYRTQNVDFPIQDGGSAHKTLFSENPHDSFSPYIHISRMANFVLWFSVGAIRYTFPKLGTELGISPSFLGLLMFILSLSQTLTFYTLGIIPHWHYRIVPLIFFQLIAFAGLVIVFTVSSSFLFLLAFVLIGVGIGMTHSSSLFYSVDIVFQRGPSVAIHEIVVGVGELSGPLIGGAVAQKFSLRAPYLVTAAVVVVGILIQILIKKNINVFNS